MRPILNNTNSFSEKVLWLFIFLTYLQQLALTLPDLQKRNIRSHTLCVSWQGVHPVSFWAPHEVSTQVNAGISATHATELQQLVSSAYADVLIKKQMETMQAKAKPAVVNLAIFNRFICVLLI